MLYLELDAISGAYMFYKHLFFPWIGYKVVSWRPFWNYNNRGHLIPATGLRSQFLEKLLSGGIALIPTALVMISWAVFEKNI